MRLKLALSRATGDTRDIVVTADAVATVGEVARTIIERGQDATLASIPAPTLVVSFPGEGAATTLDPQSPISEARIASGADVSVVPAGSAAAGHGPVLAVLRVEGGPDAGAEFQLRSGRSIIGRDAGADIVLNDALVSKRHARVEVNRTVDFVDLNSANGVVVDGGEVPRVSLESGQTVTLGETVLRAEIVQGVQREVGTKREGPVNFNRSPRVEARYPGEDYPGPEVPRDGEAIPFPWITLIAPLIMGGVLFYITGNLMTIAFVALSPVLMVGTFVTQKLREKTRLKNAVKRFEGQLARLGETLEKEVVIERQVRLDEAVSTREVLQEADALGPLLWTRRPEHWNFLNARLGVGTAPSRNEITGRNDPNGIAEFAERLDKTIDYFRDISGVPIVDNLVSAGALGIAGDVVPATEATHSVLVQLTGLHSPLELSVTAIVGPVWAKEFGWLKWLPHTNAPNAPVAGTQLAHAAATGAALLAGLEELIETRMATRKNADKPDQNRGPIALDDSYMAKGATIGDTSDDDTEPPATPCVVVLVSDDAPVDRARLVTMVERAAEAGVLVIWLAEKPADLPAACRTFVNIDAAGETGTVGLVRTGQSISDVAIERVAGTVALSFARRLAAVTDAGALVADESDIPRTVSFVDLLGAEMSRSSDAVIDRWNQNASIHDRSGAAPRARKAGRLRAIVGQSSADALHLDLRSQGPHALVGGTTGSGKSEFLQAWVLGMAAEYSPDRVTFLFIDYKGGAAFAEAVSLPHCVGLVTDLSPHLVRRALTSLRAELHFREHLLNRKKAKDLIELERRGDPESPPALVIVIDEFAALVGEVPEFVDGVVDIAQRGRSLGIHLIMATQRPAGVIRDNIRANTNLRVALRMADEADSTDVIGSSVAAAFDPSVPGRGIAKTGPGRLATFQTGYAGGWTNSGPAKPSIEIADLIFGVEREWEAPVVDAEPEQVDLGPNDTARLVTTFSAAALAAEIPPPRKPWLDELASAYDLSLLRQRSDDALVLGVADDASSQSQYTMYFRPDTDGNLAVYGTGGSGKSTLLRTLAVAAGITPRGGPVQVYGIDFSSGGLRMLESLPHVGSIIAGDDAERIQRLMQKLRREIDDRVLRYGAVRAGSIADYRSLAGAPNEPRMLLLIDGMATFRQEYEFTGALGVFPMFQQIVSDGRQVGIHVVVSADRPGSISPALASLIQRRVVLRLADDNDYLIVDAPADVITDKSPSGRAVIDQLETQIAVFGGSASVSEQSLAIDRLAATMIAKNAPAAAAIQRLSDQIPVSAIAGTTPGLIPLGVADDSMQPIGVSADGVFMLTGPPSSGRTSALRLLSEGAKRATPAMQLYYLGSAKSQLRSLSVWAREAGGPERVAELARDLLETVSSPASASHRVGIVIEGISDFLGTAADAELIALIKAAKRNDHFVIAESETSSWQQSWPLLLEIKSARRGFALQPDPQEGDMLFRTAFPRTKRTDFPLGRGWFVQAGKIRKVQLAHAE